MSRGFYTLASGMITQEKNLNVISNNMGNTMTAGFKRDFMTSTTFKEQMLIRTGHNNKQDKAQLAMSATMRIADETVTNYSQGSIQQTDRVFDFSIIGDGFFTVQTLNGDIIYTRNGSFTLDNDGYLYLQGFGRVIGEDGPILLNSDKFTVNQRGTIIDEFGIEQTFLITDFEDYSLLKKAGDGIIYSQLDGNEIASNNSVIKWQALESSNVDTQSEMISMITAQRNIQNASQAIKAQDQIMGKAVNEIGRV